MKVVENHCLLRIREVFPEKVPVSEKTGRRLIDAKVIPSVRVGRQIFIPRDRLQEFIDSGGAGLSGREPKEGLK